MDTDVVGLSLLPWVLATMQVLGVASAWLARLSEGSRAQVPFQWLFVGCLTCVGLGTILSLGLNAGGWYLSGTTLAWMAVAATCDFRGPRREAVR